MAIFETREEAERHILSQRTVDGSFLSFVRLWKFNEQLDIGIVSPELLWKRAIRHYRDCASAGISISCSVRRLLNSYYYMAVFDANSVSHVDWIPFCAKDSYSHPTPERIEEKLLSTALDGHSKMDVVKSFGDSLNLAVTGFDYRDRSAASGGEWRRFAKETWCVYSLWAWSLEKKQQSKVSSEIVFVDDFDYYFPELDGGCFVDESIVPLIRAVIEIEKKETGSLEHFNDRLDYKP